MHYEITVLIDSSSCRYFHIDPIEYKERILKASSDLQYVVEIAIDYRQSSLDGIFPLAISKIQTTSRSEDGILLNKVHSIALHVFDALHVEFTNRPHSFQGTPNNT